MSIGPGLQGFVGLVAGSAVGGAADALGRGRGRAPGCAAGVGAEMALIVFNTEGAAFGGAGEDVVGRAGPDPWGGDWLDPGGSAALEELVFA